MDPITAVSFAASILTFIDVSHQVISGTWEVTKSGTTAENAHVGNVINDLHHVTKRLSDRPPGYSQHEQALSNLASECQELSRELVTLLEKLKITPGSSKWKSAKVALRSMWKKEDVAELERRLDKYRSQILLRLAQMLNERQLSIQVQLTNFQTQSQKSSPDAVEQLTSLRNDVLETVESTLRQVAARTQSSVGIIDGGGASLPSGGENGATLHYLNDQLQRIKEIRTCLDSLLEAKASPSPEMRILKRLYFESIYTREDTIQKPDGDTFEWILKEDQDQNPEEDEGRDEEQDEDRGRGAETRLPRREDIMQKPDSGTFEWISKEDQDQNLEEDEGRDEEPDEDRGRDAETMLLRSQTRSTFLTWLRNGNQVFHLSGKAGSGKSTLMKLLLDHPRTREELKRWAGEKQLVFAHFFFWRCGDKLQRSREGLYRSILFETLKLCPDLIREVFPEAYSCFSKTRPENSIDERLFRPADFENAFHILVSKSPNPVYRFCFFIDGLDEYGEDGVDRLDHERLAESLQTWAAKDDIKILASSRPHREFQDAFSDDLRIRLHQLTGPDISRFGRNMFKRDKNFSRVRDCYLKLVEKVVQYSEGVFLWARLAIRSLLISIARHDPIDSLEKQLEDIPQDLTKLYEQLFTSISQSDREKAFKMLLLVDKNPLDGNLNALALTWLDDLDKPNFPASGEIRPYTEEEIKERHLRAECQLDGLTKGLLEITNDKRKSIFFCKEVQFFHRTVRDFVGQSQYLQDFSTRFPDLTGIETYARLLLAELWFAKSEHLGKVKYRNILSEKTYRKPRDALLDAYEKAFNHHINSGKVELKGTKSFPESVYNCIPFGDDGTSLSFPHWIAWRLDEPEYIVSKVSRSPDLLQTKGDLSILLSASLSWNDKATLKALLQVGASPNDQMTIKYGEFQTSATVWMIFCVHFAAYMVSPKAGKVTLCECLALEYFLAAGVDANCFILLARGSHPRDMKGDATHFISLRQLVQQLKPPNLEALCKLMDGPRSGILPALQATWRYLTSSNSRKSFRLDDYAPFDLDMQPPTTKESAEEDSVKENPFFVHSVQWEDRELEAPRLQIRYY